MFLFGCQLRFKHGVIKSFQLDQLVVRSGFYGHSSVHDGDAIRVGDRRQFVWDNHEGGSSLFAKFEYIFKHGHLGIRVKRAGCLVCNEYASNKYERLKINKSGRTTMRHEWINNCACVWISVYAHRVCVCVPRLQSDSMIVSNSTWNRKALREMRHLRTLLQTYGQPLL